MEIIHENLSTSWIESLAVEELNLDESGMINFNDHYQTAHVIEESSIEFVNKLKDRFEFYVSLFNQYRSSKEMSRAVKVFKISNTVNDFMLFRNSLKLIVARRSSDVVTIGFLSNSGGIFSPRLNQESTSMIHEIKAHVGAFNDVSWRFNGDKVEVEAMVKFYLSEFIRHSAR